MPLVMYSQPGRQKSAIICGENIWRWRMYNYLQDGNHDIFDKWLDKSIQYLATKDDNKQFRVSTSSNVIQANERLEVFAELYNEAFEPINTPEASCEIIADDGTTYPFTFSKTGTRYNLNAGFLPPGNYTAIGKTTYNQKQFVDSASFSVKEVQLETAVTVANHRLMFKLASETGGSMFYANQLDLLADELLNEESAKPILLERISTRSILNLQWLLYLIILLLAVEWFIRKWSGGY
jgi:hypothetical protein